MFAHHRRLIDLRHTEPVVTDGDFALLLPDHPAVWAFVRGARRPELLVAANLSGSGTARTCRWTGTGRGRRS